MAYQPPGDIWVEPANLAHTGPALSLNYQLRAEFLAEDMHGVIDAPEYIASGSVSGESFVQWISVPRQGCLS